MRQFNDKPAGRGWSLSVVVVMTLMAATAGGSCTFDLPERCELLGIHCQEGQECAARQAVCITIGGCGNGVIDEGEVCDDGNVIDGTVGEIGVLIVDSCNHDCTSTQECGNGITDPGETCDEGITNGSSVATCDFSCHQTSRSCGNQVVDQDRGEQCDPGTMDSASCNSLMAGSASCKVSACGDGHVNTNYTPPGGNAVEQCDNLGGVDTAACNGNNSGTNGPGSCRQPNCGDYYRNVAAGETCDTGGADTATCNGRDAGPAKCTIAKCGDGYVNFYSGEACDVLGGFDSSMCNGSSAGFVKCTLSRCGDGYRNVLAGETCDDLGDSATCNGGSASPSARCRSATCGDGYINMAAGEQCETNANCQSPRTCNSCICI